MTHSIVPVTTDESHGIGKNRAGDGVGRCNTNTGDHGLLRFLGDNTRVELHIVWVLIQVSQSVSDLRVRVDVLELFVWLKVEELPEFVQRADIPLATLLNTKDFHRFQDLGHIPCTERACNGK